MNNLCIGKTAMLLDAIGKPFHAVQMHIAYRPKLAVKPLAIFFGKGCACHG